MYTKVNLINIRRIHTGHVKKVLNSNIGALWKVYEKKIGDQRERWDRNNVEVKYEKDKLTRELMAAKRELLGVFSLREATQMLDSNQENEKYNRENVNEARRIYGILRPEAQSFFEEQASTHMKTKMNELLTRGAEESREIVPIEETGLYGENQPVFTSSSYTLAVTSILNSMTEDLYKLCEYLGIEDGLPERSHTSYKKIFESLENFFKLRRDGNDADEWIKRVWEKLRPHLTEELEEITNEEMSTWLKSHLRRVENNKKSQEKDDNEWYDFTRDILYDSMPYSEKVAIEDKIGYPLEEASEYLSRLLSLLKDGNVENLDELIESLKGLGLKEWFKLKPNEIEERLFGRPEEVPDKLDSKREDKELGYLLIETVSRNMEHLLDIESYSPRSILSTISKNLKTSLFEASENKWLPSQYIKEIIERVCNNRSDEVELKEYVETPLKQMLLSDYKYSQQIGPIIMTKQSNRSKESKSKESRTSKDGDDYGETSTSSSADASNEKKQKNEETWKWVAPSVDGTEGMGEQFIKFLRNYTYKDVVNSEIVPELRDYFHRKCNYLDHSYLCYIKRNNMENNNDSFVQYCKRRFEEPIQKYGEVNMENLCKLLNFSSKLQETDWEFKGEYSDYRYGFLNHTSKLMVEDKNEISVLLKKVLERMGIEDDENMWIGLMDDCFNCNFCIFNTEMFPEIEKKEEELAMALELNRITGFFLTEDLVMEEVKDEINMVKILRAHLTELPENDMNERARILEEEFSKIAEEYRF